MSRLASDSPALDPSLEPLALERAKVARPTLDGSAVQRLAVRSGPHVLSALLIFGLWGLASAGVGSAVIPSPVRVWEAFRAALGEGYVWPDMSITFGRLIAAFGLAILLALGAGLAIGTIGWVARMFDVWVTIAAAVPSLLYIVIAYLWLGLNDTAAIVAAAVVVAPSATFNVIQGVRAIDPGLSEMARAF